MLGYTYLDDPSLTIKQKRRFKDSETREIFLIKDDQEVRQSILDVICSTIGEPIQGKYYHSDVIFLIRILLIKK